MSIILEALRKSELERQRKDAPGASLVLLPPPASPSPPRHRARSQIYRGLLIGNAVLIGALIVILVSRTTWDFSSDAPSTAPSTAGTVSGIEPPGRGLQGGSEVTASQGDKPNRSESEGLQPGTPVVETSTSFDAAEAKTGRKSPREVSDTLTVVPTSEATHTIAEPTMASAARDDANTASLSERVSQEHEAPSETTPAAKLSVKTTSRAPNSTGENLAPTSPAIVTTDTPDSMPSRAAPDGGSERPKTKDVLEASRGASAPMGVVGRAEPRETTISDQNNERRAAREIGTPPVPAPGQLARVPRKPTRAPSKPEAAVLDAKLEANRYARVPTVRQLPNGVRRTLPEVRVLVHVFDPDPDLRFVVSNLGKFTAGEQMTKGLMLEAVTRDAVVLRYQGTQYQLLVR